MGLACSQIRLLTLIRAKSSNELETTLISGKKLACARKQSELASEYYSRLQTKKINYYNDGAYCPITYNYLMGDSSLKTSFIDQYALSLIGDEAAAQEDLSSIQTPATKTDNSIILTDYRGLVVLNNEYANAIIAVCGSDVSCNGNGKGSTFKASYIPQIIAQYVGFAEGSDEYNALMAVYKNDTTALKELGLSEDTTIDGVKENGDVEENNFNASKRMETFKQIISFYKPIFQACASNGWTTEYTSNLSDSEYMSNALTSGIFHLQTVDDYGEYEPGTSLQYYLNAAVVTERRDSVEQEEITAWYNSEKAKIAEKEDYYDVQLQQLSTELSAYETEIESVKSFIDDAMSMFDMGA